MLSTPKADHFCMGYYRTGQSTVAILQPYSLVEQWAATELISAKLHSTDTVTEVTSSLLRPAGLLIPHDAVMVSECTKHRNTSPGGSAKTELLSSGSWDS